MKWVNLRFMLRKHRTLPIPFVLSIIGFGAFVTALDQTVVVTALPQVMLDLRVPISDLDHVSWIITCLLYTSDAADE